MVGQDIRVHRSLLSGANGNNRWGVRCGGDGVYDVT